MAKTDRLETIVQRVLADVIHKEVKDQMGFMTITDVKITNELSFMTVFYTIFGSQEDREKTKEALDRAKGFLKNQIALHVKMRKVPELIFKYDDSIDKGHKIDGIIREIK